MSTEILVVDSQSPDAGALQRAAQILRGGGLVAFPTETVYGLAANALDADAVTRLFKAKGRPARNPVIVHVPGADEARPLVSAWPARAERLATKFWPGPLSLVLPKSDVVPGAVTAGGPTVALRVPRHPVALALLETCGLPLAGPSANRSSQLSPTRAEHVLRSLDGLIDLILDGGQTAGGIESTVVDLASPPPRLLRPGLVSRTELESAIGPLTTVETADAGPLPSPGLLAKHYAPRTPLELFAGNERLESLLQAGMRVGWLGRALDRPPPHEGLLTRALPNDAEGFAAQLYAALHELDDLQLERIMVTSPPTDEAWRAVRDRLNRAAAEAS